LVSEDPEMAGPLNSYFASPFTKHQIRDVAAAAAAEMIYLGGEEGLLDTFLV